jgi:MYXO-CTERM domain-containing protein
MLSRRAPWLLLVAGLLLSGPVLAQTVTLPSQGVIRRHMIPDLDPDQINRKTCDDNEQITFQLAVKGSPGTSYRLGAWVGMGCETPANRVGGNATCRRVGADVTYQEDASPLTLGVQEIVGAVNLTSVAAADAGTGEGGAGGGDPTVCDGSSQPVAFTLHFLLVNTSGASPDGFTFPKWDAEFDLEGPDAPRAVTAGIGENRLVISWSPASDTARQDTESYYFFCDPPAGTGTPTVDGGTPTCGEPALADANACGRAVGGNVTSGQTSALLNGVHYSVAVAAQDLFKNYGELSDSTCARPEPVTGFFEAYRDAGGKGGGGFCSVSAGRSPALAGFGVLALLGLALRRRAARARNGAAS